ncbi:MAG: hypothetical protein WD877_02820 [Candidatus Saccharimonadales bacterium]
MRTTSVIEINGYRYDAATGKIIGAVKDIAAHVKNSSPAGIIDGIIYNPAVDHKPTAKISKPAKAEAPKAAITRNHRKRHIFKNSALTLHTRAQRSKTLMRSTIAKPKERLKDLTDAPAQSAKTKSVAVNLIREKRAKVFRKHPKVARFGDFINRTDLSVDQPAKQGKVISAASPKIVANQTAKAASSNVRPMPSMVTSVSHQHLERLLDRALALADSHKKTLKEGLPRRKTFKRFKLLPRWLTLGLVVLVLVAGAIYFAWQNVPEAAMKIAAARAQVNAKVPAYEPSDFKFVGPISYANHSTTIRYQAQGQPAKAYAITQQASNLDSDSLVSNVIGLNAQVQTSQINGIKVFIYGPSNDATWVNNGIWYSIKNNAGLTSVQLLKIAQSF